MTASSNIPDGFSMGELELLAQAAAHREGVETNESDFQSDDEPLFDGHVENDETYGVLM